MNIKADMIKAALPLIPSEAIYDTDFKGFIFLKR